MKYVTTPTASLLVPEPYVSTRLARLFVGGGAEVYKGQAYLPNS